MDSKLSIVRRHMQSGEWQAAVRLAARFPRLGEHRNAILDAHSAYTNPRFVAQLGKNPAALQDAGRAALLDRFGLE
jgi:hypothetical protein